ncbi:MAG TPA: exopolysaccharide biosynthesis GT4 family glycosyltransferase EpsE [Gemmataceae bacterium]|nr:exopolysaccharide biosynthesis GT4 family glycosyltransferase EpsE [Gemmataceae bacterium]
MSEPFRLGYLVPEFPRQTHVFFWRECEQLGRRGVEPVFLSTRKPPADACPHEFRDRAAAATHYVFPPPASSVISLFARPAGILRAVAYWLGLGGSAKDRLRHLGLIVCAAHLAGYCRKRGVTHIHIHSCGQSALLAAFAQRLGGPGYSLTLHNPLAVHGPLQRQKWRHARFAIVITQQLLDEVKREIGPDLPPAYVAPMGVDLEKFRRTTPYRPADSGGPLRIFTCGRLHPCKGHDVLIRAVGRLRARGLDARLVVAGEDADSGTGQYRRDLEAIVSELGLGDAVKLPGAIAEEAVRGELESAHVFALASESEPLGVVIMEAMAMTVPVVTTAAGGTAELVRDGENGRRVPPGKPEALADALAEVLTDPVRAEKFGVAGRATVEAGFGSDRSAATIVEGLKAHAGTRLP